MFTRVPAGMEVYISDEVMFCVLLDPFFHGDIIWPNDLLRVWFISKISEANSFNVEMYLLLNIRKESSLQHNQFWFPLAI